MLSPWFTMGVFTVFAVLLFIAVIQDIRSRSLSMSLSIGLIVLSIAGFASRLEWGALIAYILLNVISTVWYSHYKVQIIAGCAMIAAVVAIPADIWHNLPIFGATIDLGSTESLLTIPVMTILWVFFFISKKVWGERGGADFNVIYTTLAVFGLNGYIIFTLVALVLGGVLTVLEPILHSRQLTLTAILFYVYLRFTDPNQRSEPIVLQLQGKKETIPFIPILFVFVFITLAIWGFTTPISVLTWLPAAAVMIVLPTVYFIRQRGWERREVQVISPSAPLENGE